MAKAASKIGDDKKQKKPVKLPIAGDSNAENGVVATTAKANKDDDARERKYRAEAALRDIETAEGHRKDKDLMRDVKACAKEKMKAYGKL
jgi:hypothetical protein